MSATGPNGPMDCAYTQNWGGRWREAQSAGCTWGERWDQRRVGQTGDTSGVPPRTGHPHAWAVCSGRGAAVTRVGIARDRSPGGGGILA